MDDLKSLFDVSTLSQGFDKGLVLNQQTLSYFLLMVAAMSAAKIFNKFCFKRASDGEDDEHDEPKSIWSKMGGFLKKWLPHGGKGKLCPGGTPGRRSASNDRILDEPIHSESTESNHRGMLDKLFGKEREHEEDKEDEVSTEDEKPHDNGHKDTELDELKHKVKRDDEANPAVVEVPANNADHASASKEHALNVKGKKSKKKFGKYC
jgi:hypothetical protein